MAPQIQMYSFICDLTGIEVKFCFQKVSLAEMKGIHALSPFFMSRISYAKIDSTFAWSR